MFDVDIIVLFIHFRNSVAVNGILVIEILRNSPSVNENGNTITIEGDIGVFEKAFFDIWVANNTDEDRISNINGGLVSIFVDFRYFNIDTDVLVRIQDIKVICWRSIS